MKQVYTVTYKSGRKGQTKVFGTDVEDAKTAAFAAYTFTGSMRNPNPSADDIIEKIELDPTQTMGGVGCQPSVQDETYAPPTAKEILDGMLKKEDA